ncbi:MAG: hypothetical protein QOG04_1027 [Actinomycetota bacterium]|nr:hypothetical protein [Actinomycetota bacterium]
MLSPWWPIVALPTREVPRMQAALLAVAALAASLVVVAPSLAPFAPVAPVSAASSVSGAGAEAPVTDGYGNLPISFEPNVGQAPGRYDFVARGQGFGMAINATGATLALGTKKAQDLVRLELLGVSSSGPARALESLPGKVNYFIGNDSAKWRSGVPTFARVSYSDILPGIDVTYYGTNEGTLEYDFVVAPHADPGNIRVGFSGAKDVALRGGSLVITTDSGAITQQAPVLYQTIGGRRITVDGRFSLAGDEVAFEVGDYNHNYPLVIDPSLIYSTYLGGTGYDNVFGIAVDSSGAAYVTGYTASTNFPTQVPSQGSNAGTPDVFVAKLNTAGSGLVYSTYLGGSDSDLGFAIAVDSSGSAYVTGSTTSTNFPMQSPLIGSNAGSTDAFVTKLNSTGSALSYSTYLGGPNSVGGPGDDLGYGIAVDSSGAAYVTGTTTSTNFPIPVSQPPFQGSNAGSIDSFVTKLNAPGSALVYSTYLGGSNDDTARGIAVDSSGAAYVTGYTSSTNFPTQVPFQGSNAGSTDAFVTKLSATGSALTYSTYLGGSGDENGSGDDNGIAVDSSGAAYVTGGTSSTNFPTQAAFQGSNAGSIDAFVTKLNAAGSALIYSTYLGGSGPDLGYGIAVDSSGVAYVAGITVSTNFPTAGTFSNPPFQAAFAGASDVFVTTFTAAGSALVCSTYLGGAGGDVGRAIAVDSSGAAYVGGGTASTNFPTQGPYQGSKAGSDDAFVTKLCRVPSANLSLVKSDSVDPAATGQTLTYTLTIQNAGPDTATGVTITDTLPAGVTYVSATAGCTNASGTVTCNVANIASGASAQVQIQVTAPNQAGTITNTASVVANETDPQTTNNQDSEQTTVSLSSANLSLTKSDSADPVTTGQNFTYTLTVQNAGPNLATGVTITDILPGGVSFVSASAGCTNVSGTVTCTVANIASGASAQVQIQVTPNQAGTITNTASVAANQADPQTADNQASEQTTVQAAITCGGQPVTIQVTSPNLSTSGTSGHDVINGTSGHDDIHGLGGNDTICGVGGDDFLFGDDDDDDVYGGGGDDVAWGGTGTDKLFGGGGLDELWGNAGDDKLYGGADQDDLNGGAGDDILKGNGGGDNSLSGDAGDDKLFGGAGNDWLFGNDDNDKLYGGGDNDKLSGGANTDDCDGGTGSNLDIGTPLCENSTNIP